MARRLIALALGLALLLLLGSSLFIVDQREAAIVYGPRGAARVEATPGAHFKWPDPLESVAYVDLRLQSLQGEQSVVLRSADAVALRVDWSLDWHVADVARFARAEGADAAGADAALRKLVRSGLGAQGPRYTAAQLAAPGHGGADVAAREQLAQAAAALGIGIDALDWTRVAASEAATRAIEQRMAAQQHAAAAAALSAAQGANARLRAAGDASAAAVLADAATRAQTLRGQGDAEAAAIAAQSFGKDRAFAEFFRTLELYRASFNNRGDILVLDASSDLLRYLRDPDAKATPQRH